VNNFENYRVKIIMDYRVLEENCRNQSEKGDRARPGYFGTESIEILKEWLSRNLNHPYVTKLQLKELMKTSSLTKKQIMGWCTNVRRVR
jgi:hypothetical protein